MTAKKRRLEDFADAIERALKKGKNPTTMVNLICRLLTSNDPKISAALGAKWVEWKYGKPTERHEHSGMDGEPIAHTIRFGNGDSDS